MQDSHTNLKRKPPRLSAVVLHSERKYYAKKSTAEAVKRQKPKKPTNCSLV
ncbi:MAG: hypothetical protein AAB579_01850 [Patescibacteria group bacterium]